MLTQSKIIPDCLGQLFYGNWSHILGTWILEYVFHLANSTVHSLMQPLKWFMVEKNAYRASKIDFGNLYKCNLKI